MGKTKVDGVFIKVIVDNSNPHIENLIENYDIEINESIAFDISEKSLKFKNCNFIGSEISFFQNNSKKLDSLEVSETKKRFKKHKISLQFENCSIENGLTIEKSNLNYLRFSEVKISSEIFNILSCSINFISFSGGLNNYNSIKNLTIMNLKDDLEEKTFFSFERNIIKYFYLSYAYISQSWMTKNTIDSINISDSFIDDLFILSNTIKEKSDIKKCDFTRINIKRSVFHKDFEFEDSNFKDNAVFENTSSLKNSSFKYLNVNFEKKVSFENSILFSVKFESVFFKEIVSFQNMECEYIDFNKTHFDKVGYFNDLTIKSPEKCSIGTLRTIKNQLNKTENKIDYLKFSVFEFNNLKNDRKTTKSDYALLWLNEYSNNFGTSWTRGICFTLITGIVFFLILLIVNSFLNSNYPLCLNVYNESEEFSFTLNYFLKFVFNLGFNDKEIQSNGWLYFIFIFAKIFIGFGIYQTIQAFRKYGK
ncbi:hypothetical protein [Flavobacterium urocaniciphilum]|uniref:Pentapeptide repeat-containing protein n=1 Tax=Flavobacterium urocaniciphilum TaxID=1299341 RepID=A0A1H9DTH8_9FLAO|nr:hypothetical protein [Flavobacterium urocaniciphilum]SEQ16741.1 hypothetical protein SAMN05444005_10859 [Flavobacterium urocaniciphilum]